MSSTQGTLLDVLKKKMRQTKEEAERFQEEAEEYRKKLQIEIRRREEVSFCLVIYGVCVFVLCDVAIVLWVSISPVLLLSVSCSVRNPPEKKREKGKETPTERERERGTERQQLSPSRHVIKTSSMADEFEFRLIMEMRLRAPL
jgi:hypothetical protein